jgi:hypothetical protein
VLVVVTTARATNTDVQRIARLRSSFPTVMVVLVDDTTQGAATARAAGQRLTPRAVIPIMVTPTRPFATAWTEALGRDRPLSGTVGGRS